MAINLNVPKPPDDFVEEATDRILDGRVGSWSEIQQHVPEFMAPADRATIEKQVQGSARRDLQRYFSALNDQVNPRKFVKKRGDYVVEKGQSQGMHPDDAEAVQNIFKMMGLPPTLDLKSSIPAMEASLRRNDPGGLIVAGDKLFYKPTDAVLAEATQDGPEPESWLDKVKGYIGHGLSSNPTDVMGEMGFGNSPDVPNSWDGMATPLAFAGLGNFFKGPTGRVGKAKANMGPAAPESVGSKIGFWNSKTGTALKWTGGLVGTQLAFTGTMLGVEAGKDWLMGEKNPQAQPGGPPQLTEFQQMLDHMNKQFDPAAVKDENSRLAAIGTLAGMTKDPSEDFTKGLEALALTSLLQGRQQARQVDSDFRFGRLAGSLADEVTRGVGEFAGTNGPLPLAEGALIPDEDHVLAALSHAFHMPYNPVAVGGPPLGQSSISALSDQSQAASDHEMGWQMQMAQQSQQRDAMRQQLAVMGTTPPGQPVMGPMDPDNPLYQPPPDNPLYQPPQEGGPPNDAAGF